MRANLRRARIPKSPRQYLSTAIPAAIAAGISIAGGALFILWNLMKYAFIFIGPLSLGLAVAATYGFYQLFLLHPLMVADGRKEKIDVTLPPCHGIPDGFK